MHKCVEFGFESGYRRELLLRAHGTDAGAVRQQEAARARVAVQRSAAVRFTSVRRVDVYIDVVAVLAVVRQPRVRVRRDPAQHARERFLVHAPRRVGLGRRRAAHDRQNRECVHQYWHRVRRKPADAADDGWEVQLGPVLRVLRRIRVCCREIRRERRRHRFRVRVPR